MRAVWQLCLSVQKTTFTPVIWCLAVMIGLGLSSALILTGNYGQFWMIGPVVSLPRVWYGYLEWRRRRQLTSAVTEWNR